MGQCVCGQYYNPGDVQCRFCGRILQDASYQGYDQYAAYPPKTAGEYDAGYAKPGGYQPEQPQPQPQQAGAQPPYDAAQRQYAPYQQPAAPQPSAPQPGAPQPVAQQGVPMPSKPVQPPVQQSAKPMQKAHADKSDHLNQELLQVMRKIKGRGLALLIVTIIGFALSILTSGYLIIVLNAILEAMKS